MGELELRSDGAGKKYNWTISRVEEVVTTKAEAPTQDETLKYQLSPVSEPTDGSCPAYSWIRVRGGGRNIETKQLKHGNFNIKRYFIRNFIDHKRKLLNTIS